VCVGSVRGVGKAVHRLAEGKSQNRCRSSKVHAQFSNRPERPVVQPFTERRRVVGGGGRTGNQCSAKVMSLQEKKLAEPITQRQTSVRRGCGGVVPATG